MNSTRHANGKRRSEPLNKAIQKYRPDKDMSMTKRAAHCLDWCANECPGEYLPYNMLLKVIQQYPRMPQLNSEEVQILRRNMSNVRGHLQKTYSRELDSQPGVGVRATFSDADTLTVALPKKMSRFRAAKRSLATTVNLIDERSIPDTAELKPWKVWMRKSVADVMRLVGSEDFDTKCLPPAATETDV